MGTKIYYEGNKQKKKIFNLDSLGVTKHSEKKINHFDFGYYS